MEIPDVTPSTEFTREDVIAGVGEKYSEVIVEMAPGAPILVTLDADILATLTGSDIAALSLRYNLAFKARPVLEVQDGSPGA